MYICANQYYYIMFYILILLLVVCASCTTSDLPPQMVEPAGTEQTARSIEDAKSVALNALDVFRSDKSRSSENAILQDPIVITSASSSRGTEADTLLYVFNYSDNEGYAVVSAAKVGTPLLAFVEKGSFNAGGSYNGGFQMFMNNAAAYVDDQLSEQNGIGGLPLLQTKYETVWNAKDEIAPRIKVEWGRNRWEGAFCPNGDAGMEAVAAAQILSYYETPKIVQDYTGTVLSPGVFTSIDWSDIKMHEIANHDASYSNPNYPSAIFCFASNDAHKWLGLLCREVGEHCSTVYKTTGTEIDPISVIDCLTHYLGNFSFELQKFYSTLSDDNESVYMLMENYDVKNALKSGFLYLVASDTNGKHYSWIADGYIDAEIYGNVYTSKNGLVWNLVESHKIDEGLFVHYNWGDYGKCNGYFNRKIINPRRATALDKQWLNTWTSEFTNTDSLVVGALNIPV